MRRFDYEKRKTLERLLKKEVSVSAISKEIGISRNGIYEEFVRNGMDRTNYNAREAQLNIGRNK